MGVDEYLNSLKPEDLAKDDDAYNALAKLWYTTRDLRAKIIRERDLEE